MCGSDRWSSRTSWFGVLSIRPKSRPKFLILKVNCVSSLPRRNNQRSSLSATPLVLTVYSPPFLYIFNAPIVFILRGVGFAEIISIYPIIHRRHSGSWKPVEFAADDSVKIEFYGEGVSVIFVAKCCQKKISVFAYSPRIERGGAIAGSINHWFDPNQTSG